MIRIVLADDHKLFREMLAGLLRTRGDIDVIALCQDGEEALETVKSEQPDIVFMDIRMEPDSGIAITEKIVSFSASRIIGLSMYSHAGYAKNMMRAGAQGYITKNSPAEEIFAAVDTVLGGAKYICDEIKNMMTDEMMGTNQDGDPHSGQLTKREIEIVQLISKGHSSKQIGAVLGVTYKTIEVHRHNILKKLKLKNASELVNYFHTRGLEFL